MHSLIQQLLEKRGVEMTDLDTVEKATFDDWQKILSDDLTLDNIKDFLESQKEEIERQLADLDHPLPDKKDSILKATLSVYIVLLGIVNGSSKVEREALINHLQNLIKQ